MGLLVTNHLLAYSRCRCNTLLRIDLQSFIFKNDKNSQVSNTIYNPNSNKVKYGPCFPCVPTFLEFES